MPNRTLSVALDWFDSSFSGASAEKNHGYRLVFPKTFQSALELEFRADYHARMMSFRYNCSWGGFLAWVSFFVWDALWSWKDAVYQAEVWRIVLVRALCAVLYWACHILMFSARGTSDPDYADKTFLYWSTVVTVGMGVMTALAPYPYDQIYFTIGTIVVIVSSGVNYAPLHHVSLKVMAMQCGVVISLALWSRFFKDTNGMQPLTAFYAETIAALVLTLIGIGFVGGLMVESFARHGFLARRRLSELNDNAKLHSAHLESLNLSLSRSNLESQTRLHALVELKEKSRRDAVQRHEDQSRFMAGAVHDLRQPVQAIVSAMYPLQHAVEMGDSSQQKTLLALCQAAVNTMQVQLTSTLDFTRLESGGIKPEVTTVDILAMGADVVNALHHWASSCGATLTVESPPDTPALYVQTDPQFMRRILNNLIGNSVKYRHTAGERTPSVCLTLSLHGQHVRLDIRDNGIGMSQALIDSGKIFSPFFQLNNHDRQAEKGVGLGLSIVSAMVSLLPDHHITATSTEHVGTTFTLDMPLDRAPELNLAAMPLSPVIVDVQLRGMYVLLVDDDELVRLTMHSLLRGLGVLCDAYASYEALRLALPSIERVPDLVLTDFRLGHHKTAIDVLQLVKQEFDSVNAVVFTGEQLDLANYPTLQGITVLAKPVSTHDLISQLSLYAPEHETA